MNDYIKDKLRLKLNLHLSSGKKREGVIDERVIESLVKEVDGLGKYEIIYKSNFPVGLVKLSDDFKVEYKNGKYYLTRHDLTHCINANEFIDFNVKEYRNIQLKNFFLKIICYICSMKTKDLDNLTQGDIVVFIKPINGWAFNKYKIGDQYKFHSFNINKNMPMSSNTLYLESLQGEVITFTPKVAYNIETLQKWRQLQLEKLV